MHCCLSSHCLRCGCPYWRYLTDKAGWEVTWGHFLQHRCVYAYSDLQCPVLGLHPLCPTVPHPWLWPIPSYASSTGLSYTDLPSSTLGCSPSQGLCTSRLLCLDPLWRSLKNIPVDQGTLNTPVGTPHLPVLVFSQFFFPHAPADSELENAPQGTGR